MSDILLDTGSSQTLVHQELVPESQFKDGEAVAIRCAHRDTVLYPLVEVTMEVEGKPIKVEAAISDTLPMSVLLGTDTPELCELLAENIPDRHDALAVITRAQEKKQMKQEESKQHLEEICEVQPHSLNDVPAEEDTTTDWMGQMDEELFGCSKEKIKKTRREKCMESRQREKLQVNQNVHKETSVEKKIDSIREANQSTNKHELDISAEEMKILQSTDPTLRDVRIAVKENAAREGTGFFARNGRRWIPPNRKKKEMTIEQLILPKMCRATVLKLAHSIPMVGHLGKEKTTRQVLQRFYWPMIHRDVAEFCRRCDACQKATGKKSGRAPMIPLPIISRPFKRIAMDIVGPLPKSSQVTSLHFSSMRLCNSISRGSSHEVHRCCQCS